jgi:hypothetical protein
MEDSKTKLIMVMKYRLVSDHSEKEMHGTEFYH